MKQACADLKGKSYDVAPHAGAWIETSGGSFLLSMILVAPHAGAWIETLALAHSLIVALVAPHAGAWIETVLKQQVGFLLASLPTRERGLKHGSTPQAVSVDQVAPHAGAWIETLLSSPESL